MDKLTWIVVGLVAVAFIGILVLAHNHDVDNKPVDDPASASAPERESEAEPSEQEDHGPGIAIVPKGMAPGMPRIPGTGLAIVPGGF